MWLLSMGRAQCLTEEEFLANCQNWPSPENTLSLVTQVNSFYYWTVQYQGRSLPILDSPAETKLGVAQKGVLNPLTIRFCSGTNLMPEISIEVFGGAIYDRGLRQVGPFQWEHDFEFEYTGNGVFGMLAHLLDGSSRATFPKEAILTCYMIPAEPLAIYPLDNLLGDDASNMENHATLANCTAVADRMGRANHAVELDGSTSHIATPINVDTSAETPGFTVALWVYPTSVSAGRHQLVSIDNGLFDWSLLREGDTWFIFNGTGSFSTGLSVDLNTWQHLVVVFDPDAGVTLFKNASNSIPTTATIGLPTSTAPLHFGTNPGGMNERFAGAIDDIFVYDMPVDINIIDTLILVDTAGLQL